MIKPKATAAPTTETPVVDKLTKADIAIVDALEVKVDEAIRAATTHAFCVALGDIKPAVLRALAARYREHWGVDIDHGPPALIRLITPTV